MCVGVVDSLRIGFLNTQEVIHYISLPIQHVILEHLTTYGSFLDLYYAFPKKDLNSSKGILDWKSWHHSHNYLKQPQDTR